MTLHHWMFLTSLSAMNMWVCRIKDPHCYTHMAKYNAHKKQRPLVVAEKLASESKQHDISENSFR